MNHLFDRSKLRLFPLDQRRHDLTMRELAPLARREPVAGIRQAARSIGAAAGAASIFFIGGHVVRAGVQSWLIDMMRRGFITCLAMNGAALIHDFETAMIGATTESVAHYIRDGRFGLWQETSRLNDIVNEAAAAGLGLGEAVGSHLEASSYPYRHLSLAAAAHRFNTTLTVHVGIGMDIVHEHPNCDGAAWGQTSYQDFLAFTHAVQSLEGGFFGCFGSAVAGPEVYLKALAMARNVAAQEGRTISAFTTLVCDLVDLPENYAAECPKNSPGYYFRPWKTILVRTVADGGSAIYVKGRHEETIPQLWTALTE